MFSHASKSCGNLPVRKASTGTRGRPVLSQRTRDRECLASARRWASVNTPRLSHQNLHGEASPRLRAPPVGRTACPVLSARPSAPRPLPADPLARERAPGFLTPSGAFADTAGPRGQKGSKPAPARTPPLGLGLLPGSAPPARLGRPVREPAEGLSGRHHVMGPQPHRDSRGTWTHDSCAGACVGWGPQTCPAEAPTGLRPSGPSSVSR